MEIIQSGSGGDQFTKFETAVEQMEGVEAIPAVAQRLLSLTSDPNAGLKDIERLIASDASLTARVLRLAASAFYGGHPAQSLKAAIVRQGLNEVRNLAVASSMLARAPDPFHRNLWQFTLSSAAFSDVLARRIGRQNFCEPFVCGLLHEIGTMVMAKVEGAPYYAIAGTVGTQSQAEREQKAYGFTHCDIGALAVERWNLFAGLEEVVQFHHDPFSADSLDFPPPVLATIYLVALVSAVLASPDEALGADLVRELMARLGAPEGLVSEELQKARSRAGDYLGLLG